MSSLMWQLNQSFTRNVCEREWEREWHHYRHYTTRRFRMTAKLCFLLFCPHITTHSFSLSPSLSPGMKNIFQTTKLFKEFFWWQISQYSGKKSGDLCMQKSPDMRVDKLAAVSMCWGWRNSAIFIIFSRTHTTKAWQIFILKKFIVLTQT